MPRYPTPLARCATERSAVQRLAVTEPAWAAEWHMTCERYSTVRYQTVTIGRDLGSWVEVTGGLSQGTHIVINPPTDLQDGARVRVVSAR